MSKRLLVNALKTHALNVGQVRVFRLGMPCHDKYRRGLRLLLNEPDQFQGRLIRKFDIEQHDIEVAFLQQVDRIVDATTIGRANFVLMQHLVQAVAKICFVIDDQQQRAMGQAFEHLRDFWKVQRLFQNVPEACVECGLMSRAVRIRGQQNRRQVTLNLSQLLVELDPVEPGHAKVDDGGIVSMLGDQRQGLAGRSGAVNPITELLENVRKARDEIDFVVNDKQTPEAKLSLVRHESDSRGKAMEKQVA